MPTRPILAPFVVAVAVGSTAYIAAFTAAALAAREITGSAQLSGLPSAFGTLGTAVGIGLLSAIMGRRGRRAGLLVGLAIAVLGATGSVTAVVAGSFVLLVAGSVAIGFGNAAIQLARYAASDLVAPERRAAVVGVVVWGSTVGAVLGPNLLQPAGAVAALLGRPALEGGMAVAFVGFVLMFAVTVLFIRVTPVRDVEPPPPTEGGIVAPDAATAIDARPASRRALLASTRARIAVVAMVSGQIVMVLVMTMTPVHVHDMGHGLATVGFVISAHTLGMFALSPVSGRLVVRFGTIPIIYAGFAVLLAFVAGSSLLTAGASLADRIRLQGTVDVGVWVASGIASVSSGVLLDRFGYPVLSLVAGALLALPAVAIWFGSRSGAAGPDAAASRPTA
jgi:MFS family permease